MVRIALVDDDVKFQTLFSTYIRKFFHQNNTPHELRLYNSPETLRYDLKEGRQSDLYFLNMEMSQIRGCGLTAILQAEAPDSMLVLLTSHLKDIAEDYELQNFGCIPKNLASVKIAAALEEFLTAIRNRTRKTYMIENSSRFERVEYEKIIYMYKEKKNTILVLKDRRITIRKPLWEVIDELDSDCFMYIERGYAVNREHIIEVLDKELVLRDGATLPMGRIYVKKMQKAIRGISHKFPFVKNGQSNN